MPETTAKKKTGNKIAIQLRAIGQRDAKGRFHMVFGYDDKFESTPDLPLSSILIPLARDISALARYSSPAAAQEDMATLMEYLSRFKAADPKETLLQGTQP